MQQKTTNNQVAWKTFTRIKQSYILVGLAIVTGILIGIIILRYSLTEAPGGVPRIGQTVVTDNVTFKVHSTTEVAARELMTGKVIDGEKGIIVKLSITNNTPATQPFLPVNQVFLKSRDGKIYQLRPVSGINNPIKGGDLAPKNTTEGELSFMVDKTSQELWLYLDTRWGNSLPIVIDL